MTKIIGFAGRKGSGKSTCSQILVDHFGARRFSFAGPLKEFCVRTLGLKPEQCYGTDEQKNFPTKYRWENLPDYSEYIAKPIWDKVASYDDRGEMYFDLQKSIQLNIDAPPTGFMNGRQIMQQWADILKRQDPEIFLNAFVEDINHKNPRLAVVDDSRFAPETEAIFNLGSDNIVLRCTRAYESTDTHISETALDDYKHPRYFIFDNASMTKEEQEEELLKMLAYYQD